MRRSLERTLAVRFAATMAVGLAAASAAILWGVTEAVRHPALTGMGVVVVAMVFVVVLGTAATFIGASWLARSAIEPVREITAQATRIEGGTLDQRIAAHADTREYEGLVGVLNRMLERIERAFAAQRRLTADVSHELRTPLTALRGEVEVALRSERRPQEYQRVLHSALEEIDRLSHITDDALLLTRVEAHDAAIRRMPADLNALVGNVVEQWRPRAAGLGVSLEPSLDLHLPPVPFNTPLLARLLDQLVHQAVRRSPSGGVVTVGSKAAGNGTVHVWVRDAGAAIEPRDVPHMFEAFYRTDPARPRDGEGPGLGLAMVEAIARLHGGRASVTSTPGGTQFDVWLTTTLP